MIVMVECWSVGVLCCPVDYPVVTRQCWLYMTVRPGQAHTTVFTAATNLTAPASSAQLAADLGRNPDGQVCGPGLVLAISCSQQDWRPETDWRLH